MGFSDRLQISKVTTKEPENTEEWLQRFIEILLKENSKDKERHCRKKGKLVLASKKQKEENNGST